MPYVLHSYTNAADGQENVIEKGTGRRRTLGAFTEVELHSSPRVVRGSLHCAPGGTSSCVPVLYLRTHCHLLLCSLQGFLIHSPGQTVALSLVSLPTPSAITFLSIPAVTVWLLTGRLSRGCDTRSRGRGDHILTLCLA